MPPGGMFASLEEPTKTWALERYTPHPVAAMNDRVKLPSFWQQKLEGQRDLVQSGAEPRAGASAPCADKLGATWHELDTGHYPMLTAADDLARLIVEG